VVELPAGRPRPPSPRWRSSSKRNTIYRVKGFVAIPGKPMRLLVQGVGRRFDHHFDRRWQPGRTPSARRSCFIGEDLDEAAARCKRGFDTALAAQAAQG
jgi:cobalamin biosynthesis protein CobW